MSYRDQMPDNKRVSYMDFAAKTPADRKLKSFIDQVHNAFDGENPIILEALSHLAIEHYQTAVFNDCIAVSFVNSEDQPKTVLIPHGSTLKQVKDIILEHHPIKLKMKARPEDVARPETLERLRQSVMADAGESQLDRIEKLLRRLVDKHG